MESLKFEDKRGRTVKVSSVENNIAILNNGERVSVERLKDPNFFTPLDENNNSSTISTMMLENNSNTNTNTNNQIVLTPDEIRYKNLANNKSFSIGEEEDSVLRGTHRGITNPSSDIRMSGSVVETHNQNLKSMGKDIVEEHHIPVNDAPYEYNNSDHQIGLSAEEELLRKYGATPPPIKKSDPRLEEIAYGKKINTNPLDGSIEDQEDFHDEYISNGPNYRKPPEHVVEINPVHQMFDKAKKVHSLNVSLKLNEKIPSKEAIKMMEESFDESAIDYYAKEIYKKLMEDPSVIEDQVKIAIGKYLKTRPKNKNDK